MFTLKLPLPTEKLDYSYILANGFFYLYLITSVDLWEMYKRLN